MSSKKKQRIPLIDETTSAPLNSTFAVLANKMAQVPAAPGDKVSAETKDSDGTMGLDDRLNLALKRLRKPHVFKNRKGRGGKTVTEIDHLEGVGEDLLAPLCKRLCKSLGCGGSVAEHTIVVQGDQVHAVNHFFDKARKS